jgi:predicted neuraminidase
MTKILKSILVIIFCLWGILIAKENKTGEFIFDLQGKHVHGSSIVECPNGDLLACWFYGSGERTANDVLVQGARLKKGFNKWSPVFTMADTPDLPDCNPVLFIDKKQKLWLFWIAVQAARWERSVLKYRTSLDYQKDGAPKWHWQDVILLQPGNNFAQEVSVKLDQLNRDEGMWAEYALPYSQLIKEAAKDPVKRQTGWMTRIHPLMLSTGRILLPLYSDGFNVSLAAISDDEGETWKASLPIVGYAPIQPSIIQKKDGILVSYMRDSGDSPNRILISTSEDDGNSWSAAIDTDIPNPGSSLEVIALKDGRWIMIFNDTENGRHQLALALSDDEGKSWSWKRYLEKAAGGFGYPSIIQTKDGKIHATYSYHVAEGRTIKHVELDVDWIKNR